MPPSHTDLLLGDRQGIEIDYCPRCRGVWLDRWELDTLIEAGLALPEAMGGGDVLDLQAKTPRLFLERP